MLWSDLEKLGRFFDPWREFERMSEAISRLSAPVTVKDEGIGGMMNLNN